MRVHRPDQDSDPARWKALGVLSAAVLFGMSIWLTASAIAPELQRTWGLTSSQVGWLTTLVQLGFVSGTAVAAILNLADVVPSRRYFAVSGVLGGLANAAILIAPGYGSALVFRFLTGFFLAGVYPPAMKMISTWFRSSRGMAIGAIVGALTVGKATPYLLKLFEGSGLAQVIVGSSSAAVGGAVLVLIAYRDGPYPFLRPAFSWGLVMRVIKDRPTRLATGGYLGHMWELYAAWSTIGLFYVQYFGAEGGHSPAADLAAFGMIAAGGLGAVMAGSWADRWGRERTTIWMMAISGACALSIGWLMDASPWIVVPLALIWGFTIVADSAQFSAIVTEVAPEDAVGTALMLQTSVGFLLTAVSIQLTVWLADVAGWQVAYGMLAIGPVFGIVSMVRLRRVRA
ncbi:MAG: MFS transporter [Gemmatimonadota bacterium]|nr:MAG: MFS transporter [Gemmatimonadota bacterium]